jgi:hypothetical protein
VGDRRAGVPPLVSTFRRVDTPAGSSLYVVAEMTGANWFARLFPALFQLHFSVAAGQGLVPAVGPRMQLSRVDASERSLLASPGTGGEPVTIGLESPGGTE